MFILRQKKRRLCRLRNVLVATDVAARGLDLKRVSVVVSYEPAVPWLGEKL
jgi:superfamily II DNA/RNA helicase